MDLSMAQRKALALLPKITGALSVGSSTLVAVVVLRDPQRRSLCYHRLILGISVVDMSASFWLALSTWPIPAESNTLWSVGTDTTCRVQGFFTQFGIASSFYNAGLAIYFWLVVVRGWKEAQLQQIEWMLHGLPILWAFTSALTGLILDVYGNALLWCWVSAQYETFRWAAFYGVLWANIAIVSISCGVIYTHVRRLEAVAAKHRHRLEQYVTTDPRPPIIPSEEIPRNQNTSEVEQGSLAPTATSQQHPASNNMESAKASSWFVSSLRRMSSRSVTATTAATTMNTATRIVRKSKRVKAVAQQCFLYAASFYVNWAALSATRLIQTINGKVYYPLILIAAITVPCQGLPNFIIYLLPKLRTLRRNDPDAGWWNWFGRSIGRIQINRSGTRRRKQPARRRGAARRGKNALADDSQNISSNAAMNPSDVNADDVLDYDGEEAGGEVAIDRIGEEEKSDNI